MTSFSTSPDTLRSRLRESFRLHAARPALEVGSRSISYAELSARAEGVALALSAHGIGPGQRVGLFMEKSVDGLAVLLGSLLAGAACVPLDLCQPSRMALLQGAASGLAALVVDDARRPLLADAHRVMPGLRLVLEAEGIGGGLFPDPGKPLPRRLARLPVAALRAGEAPASDEHLDAETAAFILPTSGSAGRSKSVVVSHRAALSSINWALRVLRPTPEDRLINHAPWHYHLATFDLLVSLLAGASVRLLTAGEAMLAPWIARNLGEWGITIWHSLPSTLIGMLEQEQLDQRSWPQARLVLFGGEPFPAAKLGRLRRALPGARLFNLFSSAETSVCTYHEIEQLLPEEERQPVPIGKVCEQLDGLILDDQLAEVPAGGEGELWIAGPNLFSHYWCDEALTRQVLRPGLAGQASCFDTGDRVRRGEDGSLLFLGRRDQLLELLGHRVGLLELENTIASFPTVTEAAVLPVGQQRQQLVGFISWREPASSDELGLRAHLCQQVPPPLVPDRLQSVERLPRLSNGRVDRAALAEDAATLQGAGKE